MHALSEREKLDDACDRAAARWLYGYPRHTSNLAAAHGFLACLEAEGLRVLLPKPSDAELERVARSLCRAHFEAEKLKTASELGWVEANWRNYLGLARAAADAVRRSAGGGPI